MEARKPYRIRNAKVVFPYETMNDAAVIIRGGCFARILEMKADLANTRHVMASQIELDFEGDFIVPGLVDLHVHGAGGADMMSASQTDIRIVAKALLREGTTAFLGTTMSASMNKLKAVAKVARSYHDVEDASYLIGLHMEGPFLHPAFKGAQPEEELVPLHFQPKDLTLWQNMIKYYAGTFRIVTLAPDHPAANALIPFCAKLGIVVSAGHSAATYEQMQQAEKAGVGMVTHTFNAMPGIHHRNPGLLTAGLLNPNVALELIADGIHVHPAVLELVTRIKTVDDIILVSDGTSAVGMPEGDYELGEKTIYVRDKQARLADGTLAGSAASLLDGVRTMVQQVGIPLHRAVRMASFNPACMLGIYRHFGYIYKGGTATFLRLDPELNLKEVWVRGARIH